MIFVSSLEFQVGSCLYVTAAVKAASHFGRAQGDHSGQSQFKVHWNLWRTYIAPPSPPSLPLSLFAFWGFPECNTQDLLFLSLVCPWTIVRSWKHLPFSPLPFSPSLFLSFSFSSLHPLPWASLDAFVIAGSPTFLGCVLGRLGRSWEHLCFLLSLLLFSSSPPPSFLARGVFTSKLGFCNRFLNEVWTVIGLSPFTWFPFHPPPQTFFPFFSFMSFCLHVSSSSSFLSLARTFVRTLVCTHTRTRTLLTARFRWPRFVTMRFGSAVVPLHLVPFHRQPHTHTFVCLVLFIFICPFCAHMCPPPFRAGWRSHMPPFGEACVCV